MAGFGFRLARVRELKDAQERQAKAAVAMAAREVSRCEEALAAAKDALRQAAEPLSGRRGQDPSAALISHQPVTAGDLRATAAFVQRLRGEQGQAESCLAAAAALKSERVRDAVSAWQAASILRRLEDRRRDIWMRELETQVQRETDDRTGAAWQRRDVW
jgi:flagellar biosynthesis chaperone FliJ